MKKTILILICFLLVFAVTPKVNARQFEFDFNGRVDSYLDNLELVYLLQSHDLLDNSRYGIYENDNGQGNFEYIDNYVRYSTQNKETGFYSFKNVNKYTQNISKDGFSIVYKFRPPETNDCIQFMMEFGGLRTEININNNQHGFTAFMNDKELDLHNREEFFLDSNEWYNVLISIDRYHNYSYLLWQESDPSNHILLTVDLSDISYGEVLNSVISEISVFGCGKNSHFDFQEMMIFEFSGYMHDAQMMNQNKQGQNGEVNNSNASIDENLEVKPIEENPYMLPEKVVRLSDLVRLSPKEPMMSEDTTADSVIDTMLGSAKKLGTLEGEELKDNLLVESDSSKISVNDEYTRVSFSGNDGAWAHISIPQLSDYAFGKWGMDENSNSAMLIKHRRTDGVGFGSFYYNPSSININAEVDYWYNSISLKSWDENIELSTEKDISINATQNKWFYTLIAMDKNLNYRYITWQADNPQNYATYAYDFSKVYESKENYGGNIEAYIDFFYNNSGNKKFDLEFLSLYEFEDFADIEIPKDIKIENNVIDINDEFKDKYEKYQYAVDLFNDGHYYNSYLLLNELDGYSTSGSYLAECERLLSTIEINNPYVSEAIKWSLKKQGIFVEDFLYVYQAEHAESLDLTNCVIEDLSFIEHFPNLKELILDDNPISDLMPLKDLYSLESLSIVNNSISDTMPLYNLTNLKSLNLSNNFLREVDGLSNLENLLELNLSLNELVTLDGLYNLEKLEKVDVHFNYLISVEGLNNSPVKELNILNTEIDDLGAVSSLHELETLYAGFDYGFDMFDHLLLEKYRNKYHSDVGIVGLKYLKSLQNLNYLYITGMRSNVDVDETGSLTNIKGLCLSDDMSTISNLPDKFELNIVLNEGYTIYGKEDAEKNIEFQVKQSLYTGVRSSIDGILEVNIPSNVKNFLIETAPDVTPLRLKINVSDKASLERVIIGTYLSETGFDMSNGTNKIIFENLDAFSGCVNLREIYINDADITDISGLADCPKLEIVQLKDNYIRDVSALADKIYLYRLELDGSPGRNSDVLDGLYRLK